MIYSITRPAKLLNRTNGGVPPGAIDIGRGSPWNNPFRVPFDGDAATVLRKHERWLAGEPALLRALDELRGRDLVCSCAPRPCHGDILLRLAAMTLAERLAWSRAILQG